MALAKVDNSRFTKNQNGGSSANRVLQDILHLPYPEPWWRRWLGQWEDNLTVAGRTLDKGWVIPQQLGIALIILILGGVGTLYWTMSARIDAKDNAYQEQRDLLIRMDQRLMDKEKHDNERFQKLENRFESVEAWQQVTNKDLAQIKARGGSQ
jgi:hypothetical protein